MTDGRFWYYVTVTRSADPPTHGWDHPRVDLEELNCYSVGSVDIMSAQEVLEFIVTTEREAAVDGA